jgi:hypothetical protein
MGQAVVLPLFNCDTHNVLPSLVVLTAQAVSLTMSATVRALAWKT